MFMYYRNKATRIDLFDFTSIPMRTFHAAWVAFFVCFFGWFGIAPLMPVIREELHLTKGQIGNTIIASVAFTIVARPLIGWLCDRIGARKAYTLLLILGSLPVMGIGLANDYPTFLIFRLAIGAIGASFVITQFHTSMMFAPNIVGTANATTAGWGNLGGGVAQIVMPVIFSMWVSLGVGPYWGWRMAMMVPGVALLACGIAYYFVTKDTPDGNYSELQRAGVAVGGNRAESAFLEACRDPRVWALFALYGACFGVELTINNIASLYFTDYFKLDLKTAGLVASLFGMMNIFARTLGGICGDKAGKVWGLRGRVWFLGGVILAEGIALMAFSQMTMLPAAIALLVLFSLFVQMSEGATFSVVPFLNRRALGAVAGVVGAGGNLGAIAAGFLFKNESLTWPLALLILGAVVAASSLLTFVVRFSDEDERAAYNEMNSLHFGRLVPARVDSGD
jgi:NNP family nitrate/nitrite transporter-like MFS transporter